MTAPMTIALATLTDDAAHAAAAAAVAHGRSLGLKVSASVVDAGGNLQAFLRGNGAVLTSVSVSQDKAYTAAAYGRPSGDVGETLLARSATLRTDFGGRPHMALFAGGLPIIVDGVTVGGIGVSGATSAEDAVCAAAGLAAIGIS